MKMNLYIGNEKWKEINVAGGEGPVAYIYDHYSPDGRLRMVFAKINMTDATLVRVVPEYKDEKVMQLAKAIVLHEPEEHP